MSAMRSSCPPDGPVMLLLHGWPYDIHSYAEVAPLLAAAGIRHRPVPARLWHDALPLERHVRNGQQAAVALDTIELMDALEIDTAIVGGSDWGSRTADIVARSGPTGAGASSR